MIVGASRRAPRRIGAIANAHSIYSVPQVQKGRLVTCLFTGFYQGRIDNLGGGIEHQNAMTMGVASVGLCTVLPYRNEKTHRDGILGSKIMNAFCYLVAYNVGLGIARSVTPAHGEI